MLTTAWLSTTSLLTKGCSGIIVFTVLAQIRPSADTLLGPPEIHALAVILARVTLVPGVALIRPLASMLGVDLVDPLLAGHGLCDLNAIHGDVLDAADKLLIRTVGRVGEETGLGAGGAAPYVGHIKGCLARAN